MGARADTSAMLHVYTTCGVRSRRYLWWNARYAPIMMLKQTVSLSLTRHSTQMREAHYKNLSHPFRPKFMVIEMPRFSWAIQILLLRDWSGNSDNVILGLDMCRLWWCVQWMNTTYSKKKKNCFFVTIFICHVYVMYIID